MTRSERLSAAVRIARAASRAIRTSTRPRRVRLKASVADIRTGTDRRFHHAVPARPAAVRGRAGPADPAARARPAGSGGAR